MARVALEEAACLPDKTCAMVRRRLLLWGRAHFQAYSWRAENDPWLSCVAEFLLQRLTEEGIDRWEQWMKQEFAQRRAGSIPS